MRGTTSRAPGRPGRQGATPILEARQLDVGYGGRLVLEGLDVRLHANEVLCLIGHNGAGKSTLLKALFGLVAPSGGAVLVDGRPLPRRAPDNLTGAGISMVPEGRGIFPGLTVGETMRLGLWSARVPKTEHGARLDWVMQALPALRNFYGRRAGTLSGGQQQMVSLGRALLSQPRCLLLDEPSIGLAPKLFQDLMGPIRALQQERGMSILIVEQNVREALKISDRVIVMKSGALIRSGFPADFSDNADLMELY